jgi:uncharacterized protein (AIM24 family)
VRSLGELAKVLPQRINGHAVILFTAGLKFSRVTSDGGMARMQGQSMRFVFLAYSGIGGMLLQVVGLKQYGINRNGG